MTPDEFISTIAPYAVEDAKKTRVLPSLTLAQAILESNWGRSGLAVDGKNLFGIKGKGGSYSTKEFVNGAWVTVVAGFRHYLSWAGSIADHSALLTQNKRYAAVIATTDYKVAARAIQAAGYATDPQYANKLINLIEQHRLYQYDKAVLTLEKKDAEAIIKSLQLLWGMTKDPKQQAEIHRQADIVGKAAGIR
jgi:flagellum-specific peptidoglycan hydrolase FlgJ